MRGCTTGSSTLTRTVADEDRVKRAEQRADPPRAAPDDREEADIRHGEREAEDEMEHVADRLRLAAVVGDRRAEQERQIHARQPELARRRTIVVSTSVPTKPPATPTDADALTQLGIAVRRTLAALRSHDAIAASISARWTSACGKLPRNAPLSRIDFLRVQADVVGARRRGASISADAPRRRARTAPAR